MTKKITQKIVDCQVVKDTATQHDHYERPNELSGTTYKIKPPTMNSALYITVNDDVMPDGSRRPIEVFLNSKDSVNEQWRAATTRLLAYVLRNAMSFAEAIVELKEIVDPKEAYFMPGGGGQCGGVVSHVGHIIEQHCIRTGAIAREELSEETRAALQAKADEAENKDIKAEQCPECQEVAMYKMDGCLTCVSCGHSKCG